VLDRWVRQREAGDSAPSQRPDQPSRVVLGNRSAVTQPTTRRGLGQSDQTRGQEPRLVIIETGVLGNNPTDQLGAPIVNALDAFPHRSLVGQVGLEDQPEEAMVRFHEIEVRGHRRGHAQLVVMRGTQGKTNCLDKGLGARVQQSQIELKLAGEMLVENRFAHSCPLGDVVHRGGVIALSDEYLAGGLEYLRAAFLARKSGAAGRRVECHDRSLLTSNHRSLALPSSPRITPRLCPTVTIVAVVDRHALETALSAVPGVASAAVDADPTDATIGVLRLALDTGADEVVVATAVNKVLRMQFGLGVDADRIEIVPETVGSRRLASVPPYVPGNAFGGDSGPLYVDSAGEEDAPDPTGGDPDATSPSTPRGTDFGLPRTLGGPLTRDGGDYPAEVVSAAIRHPASSSTPVVRSETAPGVAAARSPHRHRKPAPPGSTPVRMGIERLQIAPAEQGVTATVTLSRLGRHHVGSAHGSATTYGVHRAVADATVVAAQGAAGGLVQLEIVSVDVPVIGGKRVAVVQVSVATIDGKERLTGASEVRDDTRHAVVRAALDAINRRLESVLARP